MANEFDEITAEAAPEQTFSETPEQDSMIAEGQQGEVYDYTKAPDTVKAPPRVNMKDKEVIINKAEIKLPPKDRAWVKSKSGKVEYKGCGFALHYDFEGQQEHYSGIRVFKREGDKYSHPSIMKDRKNQSSKLLGLYADFKGKDINEVSLQEFMAYLNSKPKVLITTEEVKNPTTDEIVTKNMVAKFLPE